jgi:hypothetical protein
VSSTADLITKVLGVFAALLGLAGYVLVLGSAILWLRLHQADLPTDVPVSLAAREELIAIGARAVAVWIVLVVALGGLAAWIVTGNPARRRFGYVEAGLALAVTLATLLALESEEGWLLALPALAVAIVTLGALLAWPSFEAVTAVLLPVAVGAGLAVLLSALGNGNRAATAAGATFIFGVLVLLTPQLQRWRASQDANQAALAQLWATKRGDDAGDQTKADPLAAALKWGGSVPRSPAVLWVGRVAVAFIALLVVGTVAVASQVARNEDFSEALVSLTNGDCITGTFLARGKDQLVIAETDRGGKNDIARIAAIPTKEVLELQVYGDRGEGVGLVDVKGCNGNTDAMVHPASPAVSGKTTPGA